MFQKATRAKSRLRLALMGPSGSGKTFTALRLATGLSGSIAVVDTERGSAAKYADRDEDPIFGFDVCNLENHSIAAYVKTIHAAAKAGYDVLIIDSLSHAWKALLEEVDRLARAKFKGNTWSAWSEGTPMQRTLIDALLAYPGHVIATMRTKTEWLPAEKGKAPQRVGLAPEQGKGLEYEFDMLIELSVDHVGHVIKDRTGKFQDQTIDKPDESFGAALADWLNVGEAEGSDPTPNNSGTARQNSEACPIEPLDTNGIDPTVTRLTGQIRELLDDSDLHPSSWSVALQDGTRGAVTVDGLRAGEYDKKTLATAYGSLKRHLTQAAKPS